MNRDETRQINIAVEWWNSLDHHTSRKLVYEIWLSQGKPEPIKKRKRIATRLTVQGWGEGQKMLRVFPGGSVIFGMQDQGGNPVGIEGGVDANMTKAELIADMEQEYRERYGTDIPAGYKMVYQEIYG